MKSSSSTIVVAVVLATFSVASFALPQEAQPKDAKIIDSVWGDSMPVVSRNGIECPYVEADGTYDCRQTAKEGQVGKVDIPDVLTALALAPAVLAFPFLATFSDLNGVFLSGIPFYFAPLADVYGATLPISPDAFFASIYQVSSRLQGPLYIVLQ